ncbi:MAG: type II secretion system protein GspN [Deltaproteobacteria bacterium]|nr:type II secretion system protein GspN [Deltaproteobacteria bacterium]MBW2447726.1 type II secretion system protein GspN [Deltaproteobacteria bacterium]
MSETSPQTSRGAAQPAGSDARFPRWLLVLGVPIVAVLLVAFFVFLQFPFDRFSEILAGQTGAALGADVTIGGLDPTLTVGGPGFVARDVQIRWPGGERATVAAASLRPAWSTSWLGGSPSFLLDAESDIGGVAGQVTVGAAPGFDGRFTGVDLDRLPLERFAQGAALDGALDLDADLEWRDGAPVGEVDFLARDGSVATSQLPFALPYDELRGRIEFGDDGALTLEGVALEGPMISAQLEGGTQAAPSVWIAPLELDIHLQVSDRNLQPTLRSAGLRLAPDGSAELKVRGSLSAPIVR